ncbi:MAG: hypothetical protein GY821_07720 [Gammaproteobacteria bacterium]|nr:hypothetical protein [Gammaproteobacteria bacterium]
MINQVGVIYPKSNITAQAIRRPDIDYSDLLNPIANKVIGHPAPQLKKMGYCLRILLGILAIGLAVALGFFTAGLGFAPCFFAAQFGFISFFQGVGGRKHLDIVQFSSLCRHLI